MTSPFMAAMQKWVETFMRRSMRNFMQYVKQNGYSMSQINTMFHIMRQGTCGVSDVADQMGITNAAASQLLERLVQQNMVTRTEDPDDRRNKRIILTETGKETVAATMHARQMWIYDLETKLDQNEKDQIIAALEILTAKTNLLEQINEQDC
jgi:DNA-binding MarR family transcriptional regulator